MVGIVTGIVIGTIAGMVITASAFGYTAKNAGQRSRASSLQRRASNKKLRGKRLDRALIKNYKRQITAIKWGQMPLMEKVNAFGYAVNKDDDFAPLWEQSNMMGASNSTLRKLSICKSRIKIAELKNKKVGKWQKKRDKIIKSYGVGPMKEMGWMESMPKLGGGEFVNRIKGYGSRESGSYVGGVDNEIRYQMAATSDDTKGYDPGDLFQKAQSTFRGRTTDSGSEFSRFGINYPITSELMSDRFVVGVGSADVGASKMFLSSKCVILANACSKLSENPNMKKVQIIDDSQSGKEKVKYLTRSQFADYIQKFSASKEGKKGFDALEKLDDSQAKAIQETLNDYMTSFNSNIQR